MAEGFGRRRACGFGLGAELSFGTGWNEGEICRGCRGGGGGRGRVYRWLEGLRGQKKRRRSRLSTTAWVQKRIQQQCVYPARRSEPNLPTCYFFTLSMRGWTRVSLGVWLGYKATSVHSKAKWSAAPTCLQVGAYYGASQTTWALKGCGFSFMTKQNTECLVWRN